ncbi:ATP-binding protein [Mucilaginibacter sp. L3T2-6]|uniref:ATP-binding protein n=1 Tax=Mucilaginibacter sp. L3T2-6 TaxID=3062491 RepID=UPI0026769B30|nr:ATP-binding protein [Mucilaginibacter sp. L3T2-6]MDO3644684.1 ATP-binding protein [Mucilaginibacter sp. L3T2-6]MDV6217136.1 ATP-binding protein [Mucilaginibacter sp. L3T2-6]
MKNLKAFSEVQIIDKIKFENPWWESGRIEDFYTSMKRRLYYRLFKPLIKQSQIKRAVVLMGPRRVGKTVMIFHLIQDLIDEGINPQKICYLSIDNPIYSGIRLEKLFELCRKANNDDSIKDYYVIFDEIQYLKDWERHLKTLVDSYHYSNFIASGSAAAALRLKSNESGAGRFTDFILPPLTFHEYIDLKNLDHLVVGYIKSWNGSEKNYYRTTNINEFNRHFIDYINYGGYPELSLSKEMQANPGRYVRNDIIDKVLLRDLPSLYGIQDVQELNTLFSTIAYNSGNEFTLDELSSSSGIAKNTIRKYITYLEAAFLIKVVNRIDINAKKFKRANFFKIYLTNPSLRTALFSPIGADDDFIGNMVETAIFSQWSHNTEFTPYYARWKDGEVDIVGLNIKQKPSWAVEIKWSNRYVKSIQKLANLKSFCIKNNISVTLVTTLDIEEIKTDNNLTYDFSPSSTYCYTVGRNAVEFKSIENY